MVRLVGMLDFNGATPLPELRLLPAVGLNFLARPVLLAMLRDQYLCEFTHPPITYGVGMTSCDASDAPLITS